MDRRSFIVGFGAFVGTITVSGLPEVQAATPNLPATSLIENPNVRAMLDKLKQAINEAAEDNLFENDVFLRKRFVELIEYCLEPFKTKGVITDYKIVCDETNNIPELIDKNGFATDVYIKPTKAVNYIQLNTLISAATIQTIQ